MKPTLTASWRPSLTQVRWLRRRPNNRRHTARAASKVLVIGIVVAVGVGAGALALFGFAGGSDALDTAGGTAEARRGDLVITVSESGSLRAKESVSIINEVEGQSTIAEIVPASAHVPSGNAAFSTLQPVITAPDTVRNATPTW